MSCLILGNGNFDDLMFLLCFNGNSIFDFYKLTILSDKYMYQ